MGSSPISSFYRGKPAGEKSESFGLSILSQVSTQSTEIEQEWLRMSLFEPSPM